MVTRREEIPCLSRPDYARRCWHCGTATQIVFSKQMQRRGAAFPVRTVDANGDPHLCTRTVSPVTSGPFEPIEKTRPRGATLPKPYKRQAGRKPLEGLSV